MTYTRFAIYDAPFDDAVAGFGATWLCWDVRTGSATRQTDVPGLDHITMTPRKYGFHGTLKPPFRLAVDRSVDEMQTAAADLAGRCAPAISGGLTLTTSDGFLALTPSGDLTGLERVARACVHDLDPFRAPASKVELARRRGAGLSARLAQADRAAWMNTALAHLPPLADRYALGSIALCGERPDGRFELIQRYTLTG